MAQHNQRELSKVLTAQIYDVIEGELSDPIVVSKTMANDSFLIEELQKETGTEESVVAAQMKKYLNGIQNGLNYEAAFVVSERTRRYYTPAGINKIIDPEHYEYDRWYSKFVDSGLEYDLDVDSDEFSQDAWTVFVNCRMNGDNGKMLGVCGVGVRMTSSQELFYNLEKDYNVRIRLIDENHLVLVDIDEDNIENAYLDEIDLKDIRPNEYRYQKLGNGRIAVTRYIDGLGWYLVVQSDGTNEQSQFLSVILLNIAVFLLIMLILFLMAQAWFEPIVILVTTLLAVLLNMGTNALLPSVSITTNFIGSILQAVLSLDYCIVLLNRYRQEQDEHTDRNTSVLAANRAIKRAAPSILSSALTTVVGLLMLCFMRLKIGADMGIVLAKGVVCSLICTFTALPSLMMLFRQTINKTAKKAYVPPTDGLAKLVTSHKVAMAVFAIVLFFGSWYMSRQTTIFFSAEAMSFSSPVTSAAALLACFSAFFRLACSASMF